MSKVFLRKVKESDISYIHKWWNEQDNFGATGIKEGISYDDVLLKYKKRNTSVPEEKWFIICLKDVDEPAGIIIIAPDYPEDGLVSIGSIIIDNKYKGKGYGRRASELPPLIEVDGFLLP